MSMGIHIQEPIQERTNAAASTIQAALSKYNQEEQSIIYTTGKCTQSPTALVMKGKNYMKNTEMGGHPNPDSYSTVLSLLSGFMRTLKALALSGTNAVFFLK